MASKRTLENYRRIALTYKQPGKYDACAYIERINKLADIVLKLTQEQIDMILLFKGIFNPPTKK